MWVKKLSKAKCYQCSSSPRETQRETDFEIISSDVRSRIREFIYLIIRKISWEDQLDSEVGKGMIEKNYLTRWFQYIRKLTYKKAFFSCLTLGRRLRRILRMRWFFDVSKVKESSFSKSDLTDPPSDFSCASFGKYQFKPFQISFFSGFYIKIIFWVRWLARVRG